VGFDTVVPLATTVKAIVGCARLFRPTYAKANVGHPSGSCWSGCWATFLLRRSYPQDHKKFVTSWVAVALSGCSMEAWNQSLKPFARFPSILGDSLHRNLRRLRGEAR
jgi:hypothetical protein